MASRLLARGGPFKVNGPPFSPLRLQSKLHSGVFSLIVLCRQTCAMGVSDWLSAMAFRLLVQRSSCTISNMEWILLNYDQSQTTSAEHTAYVG